ncbi:hypothetical protein ACHAWT_001430 [Skeletonema menzelii]
MKPIRGGRSLLPALFAAIILSPLSLTVFSLPSARSRTRCAPTRCNQKLSIRHSNVQRISTAPPSTFLSAKSSSGDNKEQRPQLLGRRDRKKRLDELQKQRRRNRWMKRYGTVEALKQTFGTGPPWGDLSPTQTRSLYHTLLPRSLLALNEMGLVKVEDLAPLAYEARIAAKNYARSRCVWTGRVGVFLFDQYRSLRDKGRLVKPGTSSSMSWEEIWAKYESQIISEQMDRGKELGEDELMMQTYMRILEKSCSTNQAVDNLFLKDEGASIDGDDISLASIASQLEKDVRAILLSPKEISKVEKTEKRLEKKQLKEREKEEKMRREADRKEEKRKRNLR